MALSDRPRMRRLIARSARRALASVGIELPSRAGLVEPEPEPAPEPAPLPEDFLRELRPGRLASELAPVSTRLFDRLNRRDAEAVERALEQEPELRSHYASAPPEWHKVLVLAYGLWFAVPSVVKKTKLIPAQPPEDVHAMARGPLSAAGGLYEADLVAAALASAGVEISEAARALDFGCSSGRVVRVLAAAYPHVEWRGCDPNARAIAWAAENLPEIDFFVSPNAPPLDLADASLDLVYAISIWSHFAPPLGMRWFEEMRRVLGPGGHLLCTTHGLTSVD